MKLLYFMLTYKTHIFLCMFATLAIVAVVNFLHNSYAKQNAKLAKFNKRTVQKPNCLAMEIPTLPNEYQRQWRAFVNSRCAKPSAVFEFVKLPQKHLLWFAHAVALVVCLGYVALSVLLQDVNMFAIQAAFLLASTLVVLLSYLVGKCNLCRARKVFGKFLHDLNRVTFILKAEHVEKPPLALFEGQPATTNTLQCDNLAQLPTGQTNGIAPQPTEQPVVQQTTAPTEQPATSQCNLPEQPVEQQTDVPATQTAEHCMDKTEQCVEMPAQPQDSNLAPTTPPTMQIAKNGGDVVEKAVQILQQKGLQNPRTADEQRKLNIALNNLLQACCKR